MFPKFKHKFKGKSLFRPENFFEHEKKMGEYKGEKVPESVVLCYSEVFLKKILETYGASAIKSYYGYIYPLGSENKFGVAGGFGFGSPATGLVMEELAYMGAKNFVTLGIAGAIQRSLNIGDVVVCNRAIRDEGTSYHYSKPSIYAYPSKKLTEKIIRGLKGSKIKFCKGTSWTTDAPYRETVEEIKKFSREDVKTVEMEASAVFTISKYNKTNSAAVLVISDKLSEDSWQPGFRNKIVQNNLLKVFGAIKEILSQD